MSTTAMRSGLLQLQWPTKWATILEWNTTLVTASAQQTDASWLHHQSKDTLIIVLCKFTHDQYFCKAGTRKGSKQIEKLCLKIY